MNFGDWEIFRMFIETLRDMEKSAKRHKVVKDHIDFDLDQRSRSFQKRSRSLLKRSISFHQRSRSLLKDQDQLSDLDLSDHQGQDHFKSISPIPG